MMVSYKLSQETFSCWLSWKNIVMPRLSCGSLAFRIQAWAKLAHICKNKGKLLKK